MLVTSLASKEFLLRIAEEMDEICTGDKIRSKQLKKNIFGKIGHKRSKCDMLKNDSNVAIILPSLKLTSQANFLFQLNMVIIAS